MRIVFHLENGNDGKNIDSIRDMSLIARGRAQRCGWITKGPGTFYKVNV